MGARYGLRNKNHSEKTTGLLLGNMPFCFRFEICRYWGTFLSFKRQYKAGGLHMSHAFGKVNRFIECSQSLRPHSLPINFGLVTLRDSSIGSRKLGAILVAARPAAGTARRLGGGVVVPGEGSAGRADWRVPPMEHTPTGMVRPQVLFRDSKRTCCCDR